MCTCAVLVACLLVHARSNNPCLMHHVLQNMTLDELNALKAALSLEREERVAEDDEIVQVGCSAKSGEDIMPFLSYRAWNK